MRGRRSGQVGIDQLVQENVLPAAGDLEAGRGHADANKPLRARTRCDATLCSSVSPFECGLDVGALAGLGEVFLVPHRFPRRREFPVRLDYGSYRGRAGNGDKSASGYRSMIPGTRSS